MLPGQPEYREMLQCLNADFDDCCTGKQQQARRAWHTANSTGCGAAEIRDTALPSFLRSSQLIPVH